MTLGYLTEPYHTPENPLTPKIEIYKEEAGLPYGERRLWPQTENSRPGKQPEPRFRAAAVLRLAALAQRAQRRRCPQG